MATDSSILYAPEPILNHGVVRQHSYPAQLFSIELESHETPEMVRWLWCIATPGVCYVNGFVKIQEFDGEHRG